MSLIDRLHLALALLACLTLDAGAVGAWETIVNGALDGRDQATVVTTDGSGDVVAAGFLYNAGTDPFHDRDFVVLKLAGQNGAEVWRDERKGTATSSGTNLPRAISTDEFNDAVAGGRLANLGTLEDFTVVKLGQANGNEQWAREINGTLNADDNVFAIAVDLSGDVVAVGNTKVSSVLEDWRVEKLSGATGATVWTVIMDEGGSADTSTAFEVAVDAIGDVIAVGSVTTDGNGPFKVCKLDGSTGSESWCTTISGAASGLNRALSVALDDEGDVIVAGFLTTTLAGSDFAVVKFSGDTGAEFWRTTIGGTAGSDDEATGVVVDAGGDVIAGGFLTNLATGRDFTVVKLAGATGLESWRREIDGGAAGDDEVAGSDFSLESRAVAVDDAGDAVAAGFVTKTTGGRDYAITKLSGADGATIWSREFDGTASGDDQASSVVVDAAGDVVVAGFLLNNGTERDLAIIKLCGDDGEDFTANLCHCGDGTRGLGEECDDGNTADGDGCSAVCRNEGSCENSLTCQPPCDEDADCVPSCGLCIRCGDGRTDTGEGCDDGNDVCGDGCDPNCTVSGCGSGFICAASGEVCDDGNTDPGDGCSPTCTCEGACGDGNPNLVEGCEECDAGGANCPIGTCCASGCEADCTVVSRCAGTFDCCVSDADCPAGQGCCGDGVVSGDEACDDGNAVRGDGCSELCQRECVQPLPRATPVPVSSSERKCQQTINKETSKFAKAKAKTLQKCTEAIIKDKTSTDPGPGARVNFCLTNQADAFALKAQLKIDKAASKIKAKIAKVCGGDDRACGTFDIDEATPDAIGFYGTCPGLEGRGSCTGGTNNRAICTADSDCTGGGTCATCDEPLTDCAGLATCVACIGEAAVDQAIVLYYDGLANVPAGDLQKCQTTIGKEAAKYLQQKEKNLQKCWDKALKGQHNDRCPDFAAPVDSAANKAAQKIARAESKMIAKICRKCGGADKKCDDEVRGVNALTPPFPGSNGGNDLTPSAIGFPATCDTVTVPGGPACGFGVNTLGDLVSCVACVTEFKVDCIDRARMPEFHGRAYPCECSGP